MHTLRGSLCALSQNVASCKSCVNHGKGARHGKFCFGLQWNFLPSNHPSGLRHQAYLWFEASALFAYKTVKLNPKICHGHDRTSSCCTILQSVHRVQACHVKTVCCCYMLLLLLTEGSFNRAGSIALRPCRLYGIASYKLLESWEDVRTTSPWLREIVCVDKQKASNVKFVCW